jgi:hypothetical protein
MSAQRLTWQCMQRGHVRRNSGLSRTSHPPLPSPDSINSAAKQLSANIVTDSFCFAFFPLNEQQESVHEQQRIHNEQQHVQ